ncbi:MAG: PTS sugar transporter subunit IIA [Candidatus Eisenbacteria sp.]|nr:PTS sugar transporter subunit IIA [Candidatus Eisenbacteria bacterium]
MPPPKPEVRISQFFSPESIQLSLRSRTKKHVLSELVSLLPVETASKSVILEILRGREELGSTGIGKGVAIPHCRSAVLPDLMLVFGRSKRGIDFGSVDSKPVHLFFLIASPPIEVFNMYHPVLGKIVEIVRDKKTRERLMEVEDGPAFIKLIGEVLA